MKTQVQTIQLKDLPVWKIDRRRLTSLSIELTARCNLNCRHCYINLPAGDIQARREELTLTEISNIADEAISLGVIWVLLSGGEPLLRSDFFDLFTMLKRKGLIVSLHTNATLITDEHVRFFKKYPPHNLEVSVYGVTPETYESVTRIPGSHDAFLKGLERLVSGGIPFRLKAMALRSNVHEIEAIGQFCRRYTKDYYRFDPFLTLRYDRDPGRNAEIVAERLTAEEVVRLEQSDPERFGALCRKREPESHGHAAESHCNHLFTCNAGNSGLVIGTKGQGRLCFSSWHPDTVFDLRKGGLVEAYTHLVPKIHQMEFADNHQVRGCQSCQIIDLCQWCPANVYLETGSMESMVDYFCQLAHARADMLGITTR